MGFEKAGLNLGKEIIAWTHTSANKSLLATKPIKVDVAGLKLAPEAIADTVQISEKAHSKYALLGTKEKIKMPTKEPHQPCRLLIPYDEVPGPYYEVLLEEKNKYIIYSKELKYLLSEEEFHRIFPKLPYKPYANKFVGDLVCFKNNPIVESNKAPNRVLADFDEILRVLSEKYHVDFITPPKLYRFVGKEEANKIMQHEIVEARTTYHSADVIDCTINPDYMPHCSDFRVNFKKEMKYWPNSPDFHRYYIKGKYSADDVESIDIILPDLSYATVWTNPNK